MTGRNRKASDIDILAMNKYMQPACANCRIAFVDTTPYSVGNVDEFFQETGARRTGPENLRCNGLGNAAYSNVKDNVMTSTLANLDLSGQRVLVTGGLGFVGSNLAHRCLELGAAVTVFDCLDPRAGGNIYNIHDVRDSVELAFHDLRNFDQVANHVVDKDVIFNCAASTSHPFSMREPWLDQEVNSFGVINLLEAIRRFNPRGKLVHVGTTTQLGPLQYRPADENHPEFPPDIYSANKMVSEKFVLIYGKAYSMRVSVMRLSNVYGPRASIHSPEFTFNNFFIGLALQGKQITVFGDGRQQRNAIYVDDAVEALLLASQSEQVNGKPFFVVADDHHSVAEIAEKTVEVIGKGSVVYVDWPPGRKVVDVGDAIISNKNIKGVLDWSPRFTLAEGLSCAKEYYEPRLAHYLAGSIG